MAKVNWGSDDLFEELRSTVDLRITIRGTVSLGGCAEDSVMAWGSAGSGSSTRDACSVVGTSAVYTQIRMSHCFGVYHSTHRRLPDYLCVFIGFRVISFRGFEVQ